MPLSALPTPFPNAEAIALHPSMSLSLQITDAKLILYFQLKQLPMTGGLIGMHRRPLARYPRLQTHLGLPRNNTQRFLLPQRMRAQPIGQ